MKNFNSIHDISIYQFHTVMDLAGEIKKNSSKFRLRMQNRIITLIFNRPLFQAKVSFEAGWLQMGGKLIHISYNDLPAEMQKDPTLLGKYLEQWVDGIYALDFQQKFLSGLAHACSVPVVNGKSDLLDPCRALGDIFTFKEKTGDLTQAKLAYVGSDRCLCHSLLFACAKVGMEMNIYISESFKPDAGIFKTAQEDGAESGFRVTLTEDPAQAVRNADVIYLPEELYSIQSQGQKRSSSFHKIRESIIPLIKPEALIMNGSSWRQPHKNKNEIIDSPGSIMLEVADNKLHVQKAIMILLLNE